MVLKEDVIEREGKGSKSLLTFVGLQFAIPNDYYVPAHFSKFLLFFFITFAVAIYLLIPKRGIGLWHHKVFAAFVPMPKTAINKDASAVLTQNNIRMTGQPRIIQTIAEFVSPQKLTHKNLRLRIL